MGSHLARVRPLVVHILVLVALATTTNASAVAPEAFGALGTVPLATLTLVAAALESTVRGMVRRTIPPFQETRAEADVIRTHVWACGLAAFVAVASVALALLT